jgi:hypothetical protein
MHEHWGRDEKQEDKRRDNNMVKPEKKTGER